jgi:predicted TIM-barrel fold metal-dependent hydrolase
LHIVGSHTRYSFAPHRDYTPPEANVEQYSSVAEQLGLERLVIVQPSVYGLDNSCTIDALKRFGKGRCRAVVVIDDEITDARLREMDEAGVRGVRFNLITAGGPGREILKKIAHRIAPLGWHTQVWLHGEQLPDVAQMLHELPTPVVIDHMGQIKADEDPNSSSVRALRRLLDGGRCWVKLCGYRCSKAGYPFADVQWLAKELIRGTAERCVWGTDWPHVYFFGTMPDTGELLDLLGEWAPSTEVQRKILVDNPEALYGFGALGGK